MSQDLRFKTVVCLVIVAAKCSRTEITEMKSGKLLKEGRAGRHWTEESHLPLSGDQKQLAFVGEKAGAEQPVTVAERAAPVLHSSLHVLYTHHYMSYTQTQMSYTLITILLSIARIQDQTVSKDGSFIG